MPALRLPLEIAHDHKHFRRQPGHVRPFRWRPLRPGLLGHGGGPSCEPLHRHFPALLFAVQPLRRYLRSISRHPSTAHLSRSVHVSANNHNPGLRVVFPSPFHRPAAHLELPKPAGCDYREPHLPRSHGPHRVLHLRRHLQGLLQHLQSDQKAIEDDPARQGHVLPLVVSVRGSCPPESLRQRHDVTARGGKSATSAQRVAVDEMRGGVVRSQRGKRAHTSREAADDETALQEAIEEAADELPRREAVRVDHLDLRHLLATRRHHQLHVGHRSSDARAEVHLRCFHLRVRRQRFGQSSHLHLLQERLQTRFLGSQRLQETAQAVQRIHGSA